MVQNIIKTRLAEDESNWKEYGRWEYKNPETLTKLIMGYFNSIEDLNGFTQRCTNDLGYPFTNLVELRNPEKEKGYIFFIGGEDIRLLEKQHRISKGLVEREYGKLGRCTQKSFMDLESSLSGLFWRTITSTWHRRQVNKAS